MPFITRRPEMKSNKKKPPPRPPPPKFSKYKSKSSYNLHQQTDNLIEWSPPDSPKVKNRNFGGSVSSSFSSSTSSLGSSKKSLEYEFPFSNNVWPVNPGSTTNKYVKQSNNSNTLVSSYQSTATTSYISTDRFQQQNNATTVNIPPLFGPTIIRPHSGRSRAFREQNTHDSDPPSPTLPMPSIPPPSPPKDASNVNIAYGIAIYDYQGTDPKDLSFQVNDVVILMRKINNDWYYGKVMDKEGMFPSNFVDVQVPLVENDKTVMALYEFTPQMPEDLALRPGQIIKVIKKINEEWLYGESNGQYGQFPSNFIDRIPNL